MNSISVTSKRDEKNEQTKQKLMEATKYLIKTYSYETLTIRNICKASNVSYGSFYNFFGNKENFLIFYLTHDFEKFEKAYYSEHPEFEELNPVEKILDIFLCCGRYNLHMGIDYISGFYSPKNYSLYPDISEGREQYYSFTPLFNQALELLELAIDKGLILHTVNRKEIVLKLCMFFNAVTFNWCISKGSVDLLNEINSTFHMYIEHLIVD